MSWQDDPIVSSSAQPAWMADPVIAAAPAAAAAPTSAAEQPPQDESFLHALGRNAEIQAGDLAKGAADVIALPSDTVVRLINLAFGTHMTPAAETMSRGVDAVTPQPRNATERIAGAVVRSLGGAGSGIEAGEQLAARAPGIVHDIGEALAAEPHRQLTGAIAGGAAAQGAAEAGAGPVGQAVAGMAGGFAGSGTARSAVAGGVRGSIRGGEAGRQQVAANLQAFDAAGTTPTVGQATQARPLQAAESLLSRAPGGAGVMAGRATQQAGEIGGKIGQFADQLAPQASGEQAGRAIQRGVSGEGGFLDQFKATQDALYGKVREFIPPNQPVDVSRTRAALKALNADIPDAEALSAWFKNARIQGIQQALEKDTAVAAQPAGRSAIVDAQGNPIATTPAVAASQRNWMPFESMMKLRTLVGHEIADSTIMSDVPRSKWKTLYGALTEDIGAAAQQDPRAAAAWNRANNYTRAGMTRLDTISSVIDKNGGPEAVFQAATSGTKEGATTLRAVMQSLPKDAQQMVSATVLRRLGRARPGTQNDLGDRFSTETFLTNWNSMSPQAKAVLFNRYGESFRKDMDQVAKVAANLREGSQVFRNPSGTAQASVQAGTAASFILSALSGHVGAAASIAGGVGSANVIARILTSPTAVKWLAAATRMPIEAVPVALNRLAQSPDPDARTAAQYLSAALQKRANQ